MNFRALAAAAILASLGASIAHADEYPASDVLTNTAWTNDPQFSHDVFTFVRLRPQNHPDWYIDSPDSDLNFPFRLHQLTSLQVDTNSRALDIDNPELSNYPFTYIVEPGFMHLNEKEAAILRAYLLNGGALMLDDFWGTAEWENVYANMKLIFPDREPVELKLDHPIFHTVFDIKEIPQVPGIGQALQAHNSGSGEFWEKGGKGAHYYGIFDDKGRMMVIICRNTDNGDGWEREGDDQWYFHTFSERLAYPMSINIIFYLMTH